MNNKKKSGRDRGVNSDMRISELLEFMRYAELERNDFDFSDEFCVSVYSMWYLLNPLEIKGRDVIGSIPPYNNVLTDKQKKKAMRFTAHSHCDEPQTASPDDLLIYSSMNEDDKDTVHFITDMFGCKKIL